MKYITIFSNKNVEHWPHLLHSSCFKEATKGCAENNPIKVHCINVKFVL